MPNISPYGIGFNSGANHPIQEGDALVDNTGGTISGFTGVNGFTGISGSTGALGIQGPTGVSLFGITGIDGEQGITGIQGATGIRGDTGLIGTTGLFNLGETGIWGATGVMGMTGVFGSLGWGGLQGDTGVASSAAGLQGITGLIGITGANGIIDALGTGMLTGLPGSTGAMGITGVLGATGFGLLGITGLAGATGLIGATGINDLILLSLQRQLIGSTMFYMLPGSALSANGQYLEFYSTVLSAAEGSPTTFNVTFGTTGVNIFNDTVNSANTYGFLQGVVLRLGATSQECVVSAVYSDGGSHTQRTATAVTLSATGIFVTNATNAVGGSLVLNQIVRKLREP